MLTYLRIYNPIVALLIFLMCFYAATNDETAFDFSALIDESFATYFFAKGVFCGIAVFLLGKILEVMMTARRDNDG